MTLSVQVEDQFIELPASTSGKPSILLVGLPKSGTTMLTQVFKLACRANGVAHVDLHGDLFKRGLGEKADQELEGISQLFQPTGYCYGAFRRAFGFLNQSPAAREMTVIWIVREPKDILVSRYFSDAYSHPTGTGKQSDDFKARREAFLKMTVSEYARNTVEGYAQNCAHFQRMIPSKQIHWYRYEDIIYKKREWISDMMAKIDWSLNDAQMQEILDLVDVFPEAENKEQHIRQVHPGNYVKHLDQETIDYVDRVLADKGLQIT